MSTVIGLGVGGLWSEVHPASTAATLTLARTALVTVLTGGQF
ncbi:hypothetical protein [Occultella kanbiaonis]|nr:hypothetical protein [Occultella kanbiaonis]